MDETVISKNNTGITAGLFGSVWGLACPEPNYVGDRFLGLLYVKTATLNQLGESTMIAKKKLRTVKVGSLLLDSKNARIPAGRRSDDERALVHELVEREDVRGLGASIAKLGLFPNERLVVMPQGRRYVVLEGNRRVAAVKLLINPELAATDAEVKYFRGLSTKASPELLT